VSFSSFANSAKISLLKAGWLVAFLPRRLLICLAFAFARFSLRTKEAAVNEGMTRFQVWFFKNKLCLTLREVDWLHRVARATIELAHAFNCSKEMLACSIEWQDSLLNLLCSNVSSRNVLLQVLILYRLQLFCLKHLYQQVGL
jgi:hypothetical protein